MREIIEFTSNIFWEIGSEVDIARERIYCDMGVSQDIFKGIFEVISRETNFSGEGSTHKYRLIEIDKEKRESDIKIGSEVYVANDFKTRGKVVEINEERVLPYKVELYGFIGFSFYKRSQLGLTGKPSKKGGNKMNKDIIRLYPNTEDAILISKWFQAQFNQTYFTVLLAGKEKELLKRAKELEAEEQEGVKELNKYIKVDKGE